MALKPSAPPEVSAEAKAEWQRKRNPGWGGPKPLPLVSVAGVIKEQALKKKAK